MVLINIGENRMKELFFRKDNFNVDIIYFCVIQIELHKTNLEISSYRILGKR